MSSTRQSLDSQATRKDQPPGAFPSSSPPSTPGFNAQRNLAHEVFERREEYVRPKKLRVKIGSWNVAACAGTDKDIEGWFVDGKGISKLHGGLQTSSKTDDKREEQVEDAAAQEERASKKASTIPVNDTTELPVENEIDIYALGLQEIVDINSAAEALRPYNDLGPGKKWKDTVSAALPAGYVLVAEQQLLGLLLLVYASPRIANTMSSISTTSVGTGLMGYMGNKGAVAARIVLGETTKIVFVNSHLAAGNDKASLERRNWDAAQIVQRTRFDPIDHGSGVVEEIGDYIGSEDFAFWFGDLNYRLADIPGDDVRRLLLLHTRNEYDAGDDTRKTINKELRIRETEDKPVNNPNAEQLEPSEDPSSALTTITSLMIHDQLQDQMRKRKAFHDGWQEGEIRFLPTYKYDIGSVGMFDSSEKKRAPSWCDRILYRTKRHYQAWREEKKELEKTQKRDLEMKARGLDNNDDIIFDYDPETDGDDGTEPVSKDNDRDLDGTHAYEEISAGSSASVQLEYYVSHQRVLSSDHKPLDAIFTVSYDAVDTTLKAKVHQEVAKELDRQENEGRPSVTAVFESADLHDKTVEGCSFGDLRFLQQKRVLLTVANTSPVAATFEFLDRHGLGPTPAWLRLGRHDDPDDVLHNKPLPTITLQPGDSANLEVVALVHRLEDLRAFNEGASSPEDILIMRVHSGRDHFIPVQANWLPSAFGLSINKLVRLSKDGVRKQPLGPDLDKADVKGSAPRELFRLTEALEEGISTMVASKQDAAISPLRSLDWPFLDIDIPAAAYNNDLLMIRESLDTDSPIVLDYLDPAKRTALLGQTIVLFLTYLPHRIISSQLWFTLSTTLLEIDKARHRLKGEDLRSKAMDILSVSPPTSVSFTFITFMLAMVASSLAPVEGDDADKQVPVTPLTAKMPDAILKRVPGLSLESDSNMTRRKEVEAALAEKFVPLIFEADLSLTSAKARKADAERKKTVLAAFLHSREEH